MTRRAKRIKLAKALHLQSCWHTLKKQEWMKSKLLSSYLPCETVFHTAWARFTSSQHSQRTLNHFPDIRANEEGRDILLAFDKDLGGALRKVCSEDCDDDAICLARAATIVGRDMLQMQATFTESFEDCRWNLYHSHCWHWPWTVQTSSLSQGKHAKQLSEQLH